MKKIFCGLQLDNKDLSRLRIGCKQKFPVLLLPYPEYTTPWMLVKQLLSICSTYSPIKVIYENALRQNLIVRDPRRACDCLTRLYVLLV